MQLFRLELLNGPKGTSTVSEKVCLSVLQVVYASHSYGNIACRLQMSGLEGGNILVLWN